MLLIERIHELEEQVQELRDGAPFVEEATVRSFLTQIDLAYTEDLEVQAKVMRDQIAALTKEKEDMAVRMEQARAAAERVSWPFSLTRSCVGYHRCWLLTLTRLPCCTLDAGARGVERGASSREARGGDRGQGGAEGGACQATRTCRQTDAGSRVRGVVPAHTASTTCAVADRIHAPLPSPVSSGAHRRQRAETERVEDQRDAADRKRVECVRQIRALEAELQSVRAKHTAELEHMAEVKKLWKVRSALCRGRAGWAPPVAPDDSSAHGPCNVCRHREWLTPSRPRTRT